MQKFGLLLAFAALAGFSQAADPTYTWWNGQDDSMNVSASTTGTWTIGMNINVEALKSFGAGGSRQQPTNGDYSNTGNVLFKATGDGYYEGGTGASVSFSKSYTIHSKRNHLYYKEYIRLFIVKN